MGQLLRNFAIWGKGVTKRQKVQRVRSYDADCSETFEKGFGWREYLEMMQTSAFF